MADLVIGVDLGTSGMKTILVDPAAGILAVAEQGYRIHRPLPGWAENDPEDWYRALGATVRAVVARGGVSDRDVRAISIVGQRDPFVALDRNGQVLTPAIHWTDQRDPQETERLYSDLDPQRLTDLTGVIPIAGLGLPNLVWTKRHLPDVWRSIQWVLSPKDFLAYRLTGEAATDISSPSRSVLNDWRRETWSEELCEAVGIDISILPPVAYRSWEPRAVLTEAAATEIGLRAGTVLVAGGGDDQAATLGCGVIDVGDVSIGTGSSSCWRAVTDRGLPDHTGRADLSPHVVPDRMIYETGIAGTGTSFRWFREVFGVSSTGSGGQASYEELIAEAMEVDPGADGLLFYPYIDGARFPYFDLNARGVFFGITGGHRRGHFVRAIMEAVAFYYPPLIQMFADLGSPVSRLTVDGGEARSAAWNRVKADVSGRELGTIAIAEASSLGAAILAGMGCGLFETAAVAVSALVTRGESFQPEPTRQVRYKELRAHWDAVRPYIFDAFHARPAVIQR